MNFQKNIFRKHIVISVHRKKIGVFSSDLESPPKKIISFDIFVTIRSTQKCTESKETKKFEPKIHNSRGRLIREKHCCERTSQPISMNDRAN